MPLCEFVVGVVPPVHAQYCLAHLAYGCPEIVDVHSSSGSDGPETLTNPD